MFLQKIVYYSFLQEVAELDPDEIVKQSPPADVEGKINLYKLYALVSI